MTLPNHVDGIKSTKWPADLRNVTLHSSKNNNIASMYTLNLKKIHTNFFLQH
jgi:hypothetical protein